MRKASRRRRVLNLMSLALQVGVSLLLAVEAFQKGPQVLMVGAWKAPYGIALGLDKLGGVMLVLSSATTFFTVLFAYLQQPSSLAHPLRGPLIQFLSAG